MSRDHTWTNGPDGPDYHCEVCSISKVNDYDGYDCIAWQRKIERDYEVELQNQPGSLLEVGALHCHKCDVIIYSRAGHDFHSCDCKDIFIDGGRNYMRCGAELGAKYDSVILMLPITQRELYQDWNTRTDRYGWLRKSEQNPLARKAAIAAPSVSG